LIILDVVGINFETPAKDVLRRKRDEHLWNMKDTMHMMTIKTKEFTLSIFFDLGGKILADFSDEKKFQVFLYTVKYAFEQLYLPTLLNFRILQNAPPPNSSITIESDSMATLDMSVFNDFTEVVDQINEMVFGSDAITGQPIIQDMREERDISRSIWRQNTMKNSTVFSHSESLTTILTEGKSVEEEVRTCLDALGINNVPEIILEPPFEDTPPADER
jgi:hypothetical protein